MRWPCPSCDEELPTERAMRFHHREEHGERLPNRTCKGCEVEFFDPKYSRVYCRDCNPNAGEHNGNWKGGKVTGECRLCGAEFEYYQSEKKGVYCPDCVEDSDEFLGTPSYVLNPAERMERECRECGEKMSVLRTDWDRGNGRFCSHECLSLSMSKDGKATYNQGWAETKRLALERDDHSCQRCGKSRNELDREPDVHHKIPVRLFSNPSDAHTLENVVCLCRRCHIQVEWDTGRTYG